MTKDEFRAKWESRLMGTVLDGYTDQLVGAAERWLKLKAARKQLWEAMAEMYDDLRPPAPLPVRPENNGKAAMPSPAAIKR